MTVPDFPDWQAPLAHAAQIASQGVPLLTKNTVLLSVNGPTVNISGTYASATLSIKQPSYELVIACDGNSVLANPFAYVFLNWIDSNTGNTVEQNTMVVPVVTNSNNSIVVMRGPSKADQVQLTVANLDTAGSFKLYATLLANSRVYTDDVSHWINGQFSGVTIGTFTLPTYSNNNEVLGVVNNFTIPASGGQTWLCGMGNGKRATLSMATGTSAGGNFRVHVWPLPSSVFGVSPELVPTAPADTSFNQDFTAPRTPLLVTLDNRQTTAITCDWSLVTE